MFKNIKCEKCLPEIVDVFSRNGPVQQNFDVLNKN